MFGVPLTNLLQTDQQRVPSTQIPLILEDVRALCVCVGVWGGWVCVSAVCVWGCVCMLCVCVRAVFCVYLFRDCLFCIPEVSEVIVKGDVQFELLSR